MAANKIEKALYGPSLWEVGFGALLGLIAGVGVACVYLVFKPVETVKELPKTPVRGAVYFLPGAEDKAKGADWQAKQKQFLAGGRVQLGEEELNAWAATLNDTEAELAQAEAAAPAPAPAATPTRVLKQEVKPDKSGKATKPAKPVKTAKAAKPGEKPDQDVPEGFVIPAKPNFRFAGGKLQIGTQCTLNWYGFMTDVTVQATGVLQKEGDGFVFVPETVYLGSCPLHYLPMVSGLLVAHIEANEKVSDDFRAAWAKLTDVRIDGSTLKLAVQ